MTVPLKVRLTIFLEVSERFPWPGSYNCSPHRYREHLMMIMMTMIMMTMIMMMMMMMMMTTMMMMTIPLTRFMPQFLSPTLRASASSLSAPSPTSFTLLESWYALLNVVNLCTLEDISWWTWDTVSLVESWYAWSISSRDSLPGQFHNMVDISWRTWDTVLFPDCSSHSPISCHRCLSAPTSNKVSNPSMQSFLWKMLPKYNIASHQGGKAPVHHLPGSSGNLRVCSWWRGAPTATLLSQGVRSSCYTRAHCYDLAPF